MVQFEESYTNQPAEQSCKIWQGHTFHQSNTEMFDIATKKVELYIKKGKKNEEGFEFLC